MNKTTSLEKVGKKIKALRTAKNLSIETVSKHCNIKLNQLKHIESGEVNFRFKTLARIAIVLQVNLKDLLF